MNLAEVVIRSAGNRGVMIATAESCTGGMVASALTDIAGSSAAFDRGFVTYSNEAKMQMLGVPDKLLEDHGAVSSEVAASMAEGAVANSNASLAVAVTGIAGPGGGSAEKPVGLVYLATCRTGEKAVAKKCLFGDPGRAEIRRLTVETALVMLQSALDE